MEITQHEIKYKKVITMDEAREIQGGNADIFSNMFDLFQGILNSLNFSTFLKVIDGFIKLMGVLAKIFL
ncbi:hypothetical protein [Veronia pacifica]|uniref:Uncharacterized protein n=1 Tax=Veronia pacifica TaxID=1080227 RepID=A0A1C3EEQ9_9GAMM|nr:hypothetical protein [Veronia pacifica]ODA31742.1 hypothetical protein A8L45_15290 [Veronia pacifica]